jgi:hypothetical protein
MLVGIPTEINVVGGGVVHKAVADAHGLEHTPWNKL